jgi:SPP1 family phage portal protein
MFGREVIYSSEEVITKENVVKVLKDAYSTHQKNSADIDYLYNYYKGNQPILQREKLIRPEINNKIVENHAYEIVDFKKGYVFGEPVQYVRRGEEDGVSDKIALLNEYMFMVDKALQDKDLAEWFNICGTSYRMVLPNKNYAYDSDESPFEIDTLDPRYTFVVYNNGFGKRPLMGVKYIETEDRKVKFSVYTDNKYYEIVDDKVETEDSHVLGAVPIIEYPANMARIGSFEVVLGLLDALNNTVSNRMDGIEQYIQSFMKFINCDIDETDFMALKELGAIKIKGEPGNPADVDLVSQELDQSQTQVTKDDIYQMILIICGMPDRNGANRTTGDTGQAVILRDGWSAAESRARDTELVFKSSEKKFLKIVLRVVRDLSHLDLSLSDIDIKFTRNRTDHLLVKTQGMQNQLEAGIHPQIAIATSGLYSDPEQVYIDSMKYLKKWEFKEVDNATSNQKPNPENNKIEGGGG